MTKSETRKIWILALICGVVLILLSGIARSPYNIVDLVIGVAASGWAIRKLWRRRHHRRRSTTHLVY